MRIFILGPTGSGKSFLANLLGQELQLPILEGSSWIRTLTGRWDHGPEAASFLAEASQALLRDDPTISLRTLRDKDPGDCIFVGLRNPVDFFGLYGYPDEVVIKMVGEPASAFEREGLGKIWKCLIPNITLEARKYVLQDVLREIKACM